MRLSVLLLFVLSSSTWAQGFFEPLPYRPKPVVNQLSNSNHWMAIVGDSGATGAASNKDMQPNIFSLLKWGLFFGYQGKLYTEVPPLSDFPHPERFNLSSIEPMTRVLYSQSEAEKSEAKDGIWKLNGEAAGSLAVDVQEHGNGYMLGRTLGIAAQDIVLVGQDGARVSAIAKQFARIYEMNTKTLPPLVLVSFTANDFCDSKVLTQSVEERKDIFADSLAKSWQEAAPFLKPHPNGTQIIVLPPLEVANVLENPSLLQQTVNFQGIGSVTCQRLREDDGIDGVFSKTLAQSLGGMCKSVLLTKPSDKSRVQRIKDIQNAFNEAWKKQIDLLNVEYSGKGLYWIYPENLRELRFEKGDLANDCFHPGVGGHAKIADQILKTVFSR